MTTSTDPEKVEPVPQPAPPETSSSQDEPEKRDAGNAVEGEEEATKVKERPIREATPKDYLVG